MNEFLIIGGGIAGLTTAWNLKKEGVNVLLIDKSKAIPSGGSMAAGAFISPKIGKGGVLQNITNEAFEFSQKFYKKHFSNFFYQSGVLRVPKDEKDCQKFLTYKKFNYKNCQIWSKKDFEKFGINLDCNIGFFFPEAGDCDAIKVCQNMASQTEFLSMDIEEIEWCGEYWRATDKNRKSVYSKNIILTTGYQNTLLDMEFMGVKPLWGSRGDYFVKDGFNFSLHKDFSISSVREGYVKIGATHIKSENPCLICDGKPLKTLESKAKNLIPDIEIKLKETFCGFRSGSKDFLPLVGKIVDVNSTYKREPRVIKGKKITPIYHKNIYILNGLGGRGFLLAPYLGDILVKNILYNREIPKAIQPDRLFWRWIRRLGKDKF